MVTLADIEKDLEKLDQLQDSILPKLSGLKDQRKALVDQRSGVLIQIGLGKISKNGIEKLDERIQAVDRDLKNTKEMAKGIQDKKADLTLQSWAVKLGQAERDYRQLAPEVSKIVDRYLALRSELANLSGEYNEKYGKASRLRAWIPDMRRTLNTGQKDCGDLPSLKRLNFNLDTQTITPEHLLGQRPWHV